MKVKDLDQIQLLMAVKGHYDEQFRDKGIELNLKDYEEYDIKNLIQTQKENNFEKIQEWISGEGIEVDFEEEQEEIILEKSEEEKDEVIIEQNKKKNFIEITVQDKEGNDLRLVFEVTCEENEPIDVKLAGQIDEKKFIISDEFRKEIMDKLEKTGITKTIDAKIIEKEFIPTTVEKLNEMNENGNLELEDEKEVAKRAIEAQKEENEGLEEFGEELKQENIQREDEEEKKEELSEEEKGIVEKACDITGRNPQKIKRVLTIKDPKSATDTLDNDGLDEKGKPITVLEFRSATGKEEYVLLQEDRVLDKRYYDEDIGKLVRPIGKTQGTVERVRDDETTMEITTTDGKKEEVKIQSMPSDIDQNKKQELIFEVEKIMDKINEIKNKSSEFFESPEAKYEIIDHYEKELYSIFKEYGIIPPKSIEMQAEIEYETEEEEKQEEAKTPVDGYEEGRLPKWFNTTN